MTPSRLDPFSQESAASISGSSAPECALSGNRKLIPTLAPCCENTGPASQTTETCDLFGPVESSDRTSFAAGSLARTLATRESAPESMVSDPGYGQSSPELLASYDRSSRRWKTSQLCLDGDLSEFSETWPRSGMTRSGIAYLLPPLAPRRIRDRVWIVAHASEPWIQDESLGELDGEARPRESEGTERQRLRNADWIWRCGSEPTANRARARAADRAGAARGSLTDAESSRHGAQGDALATPTAGMADRGDRGDLNTAVKGYRSGHTRWPTPTTGDSRSSGSRNTATSKAHLGISLRDAVRGRRARSMFRTPTVQDASTTGARQRNTLPLNAAIGGARTRRG